MGGQTGSLREGIWVGGLGATSVALWFLFVDAVAGRPLFTPAALGAALFRTGRVESGADIDLRLVLGYTIFHFVAFIAVGTLAVYFTHVAERQPAFLALFLVLFVMIEMGFYGLVAVMNELAILERLAWWQIGAGNLIATLVMGGALLRAHPEIAEEIDIALSGRPL